MYYYWNGLNPLPRNIRSPQNSSLSAGSLSTQLMYYWNGLNPLPRNIRSPQNSSSSAGSLSTQLMYYWNGLNPLPRNIRSPQNSSSSAGMLSQFTHIQPRIKQNTKYFMAFNNEILSKWYLIPCATYSINDRLIINIQMFLCALKSYIQMVIISKCIYL